MTDLLEILRGMLGSISSYREKWERTRRENEELKATIEEATRIAAEVKDELDRIFKGDQG